MFIDSDTEDSFCGIKIGYAGGGTIHNSIGDCALEFVMGQQLTNSYRDVIIMIKIYCAMHL